MDDLDRKMLALLNEDGRLSNNELAGKLDVSEGTIRNRIRKLADSGQLRVAGLINPDDSPNKQLMLLGVRIACSRDLGKKAEEIAALPDVLSAYITAGRYDIMVEVWIDVKGGLIRFLSESLASVDGIVATESFLVMRSYNKWIPQPDL